ncbi:hypothetical protein PV08_05092 [Exophiala spinifera]|uniref:MutL C-terminal dimerisation domain-containing protein n=1 Tax=Exophiala spinifera TaxID=91928 RepID=A0A0D1ZZ12_9EURO|nr:uncharacterized protein PV08_05092 [Exophiala spinifera]KIW17897.1 hypothetical protein PV08_05092 [Exophiala spinifera]
MTTVHSISPLPPQLRCSLSAAHDVASYEDVVEGLLRNALDATPDYVAIEIDFNRNYVSVRDNGVGIPGQEFMEGGHLAQPFCTSKSNSSNLCYGSSGRFLSNLSSLSLLTITSRHSQESSANQLTLHRGRVIFRQKCVDQEDGKIWRRGTRVEVRNLFGDLPVRTKHISLRYSRPTEIQKTFDRIRLVAVGYILARQGPESLRLSLKCGDKIYSHKDPHRSDPTSQYLQQLVSTLHQAKLLSDPSKSSWSTLSLVSGNLKIRAAVSVKAAASKTCQFISIRHLPVCRGERSNLLLNAVNETVEHSDFGVDGYLRHSRRTHQRHQLQSRPVKGVDRWLMFYICIEPLQGQEGNMLQRDGLPELSEQTVNLTYLLKTLIYQFLDKNGFNPTMIGIRGDTVLPSKSFAQSPPNNHITRTPDPETSNKDKPSSGIPFNDWPRIKTGGAAGLGDLGNGLKFSTLRGNRAHASNPASISELTGTPQGWAQVISINEKAEAEKLASSATKTADAGPVSWENPRNGQSIRLYPVTGTVLGELEAERPSPKFVQRPKLRHTKIATLGADRPENPEAELRSQKYKGILGHKKKETPIPTLTDHPACVSSRATFAMGISETSGVRDITLTKDALAKAVVIGQIDRKFVLASLPGFDPRLGEQGKNLVVLIDQHAADERVKYERLCQEACDAPSAILNPALVFEIDEAEAALFEERQEYFHKWRIEYIVHAGFDPSWTSAMKARSSHYLRVSALPAAIVTRCLSDPKLAIDLLRGSIWSSNPVSGQASPGKSTEKCPDAGATWISAFGHCPPLMVEMMKSRSCRTAIMFNDTLTLDECTQLVSGLSQCYFPFQCAHGRPTCSVLLEMALDGQRQIDTRAHEYIGDATNNAHIGFGAAWDSWTRSGVNCA